MKSIFFLPLLLAFTGLQAQLTCIIDSLPAYTPPGDTIFIAGDFNGWNPGDPAYALSKNEDQKWTYTSGPAPEGTVIEFKFTRGSWDNVEKGPNGEEIPNRTFEFGNGDTLHITIYNWSGGRPSTAAENVVVMDDAFEMPQLGRTRRIWLYYPPDYGTTDNYYPVLYMHDGQNLFDDSTSFAGEWHVDETLNELYTQGYKVPIVIGIENDGQYRLDEYSPWYHAGYGGGQGELYIDFIIQTLKPYVDSHYRTLPDRDNTGIMGSSMGGLISHYGALAHQDVFSKAGIYSPSFWYSDSVWAFTHNAGHQAGMRMYFMSGGAEGQGTLDNMFNMQDTLLSVGFSENELSVNVIPGGEHNETLWSSDFGEAYKWLFASYTNGISGPSVNKVIRLFPNPAGNSVRLPDDFPGSYDSIEIMDMSGRIVKMLSQFTGNEIDITSLDGGLYLVSLTADGKRYQGKFLKK